MNASSFPVRAVVHALGFALAVTTVHVLLGSNLILTLGMPPLTGFVLKAIGLELTFMTVLGLLLSPLLLAPRGSWLHLAGCVLAVLGLEYSVAVDPTLVLMWAAPALVGGLLVVIGWRLSRLGPWVPGAVGALLMGVAWILPEVVVMAAGEKVARDEGRGTPPAGAKDVVMVVLDTVRAQSVSAYGYTRDTTPHFDQLAREGVLFADAGAPATWSLPAHGALFTGQFPSQAGAHGEHRFLDDRLPTLASAFAEAGWETRCFTANPHISDSFGLTRGFAWTDQAWITGAGGRGFTFIFRIMDSLGVAADDKGGKQVVSNLERWLGDRPADAPPAFVFVNFLEAHFPFHQLPEEFLYKYTDRPYSELAEASLLAFGAQFGRDLSDEDRAALAGPMVDLYDGGVAYSDHLLGEVIRLLKERGTYDDTILLVLGDHGEMVGEHGAFGHNSSVYEQDLRVPLAVRFPERIPAGSRVEASVSTVGTFATLFDLAGLNPPDTVKVSSLLPALEGRPAGQPVLAERFEEHLLAQRFAPDRANGKGPLLSPRGRYRVYRVGNLKLVQHHEKGRTETFLFDLARDPGEKVDIAGMSPDTARLEAELVAWSAAIGLPPLDQQIGDYVAPELDAAATEQLRALGYIE